MASIFFNLKNMGLGQLEDMEVVQKQETEATIKKAGSDAKSEVKEKDVLFDKKYECPICDGSIICKTVLTGKVRQLGVDKDLRRRYAPFEPLKYDVIVCEHCGYAVTTKYFGGLAPSQKKAIKEKISKFYRRSAVEGDTYSYEDAIVRYELALANAVIKNAKNSERAYTCLRAGWLVRSYIEELEGLPQEEQDAKKIAEMHELEEEFIRKAYDAYIEAVSSEAFPISGMDETTMNYLLAGLSIRFKEFDTASKLISSILQSRTANSRIKDKARELKEELLVEKKRAESERTE